MLAGPEGSTETLEEKLIEAWAAWFYRLNDFFEYRTLLRYYKHKRNCLNCFGLLRKI